jgi:NTE family protein
VDSIFEATHSWISFKVRYENYFLHLGKFTLGAEFEGLYSTQPFFQNYTASVIAAPAYQPIPESKTIFLEEFRTMMYGAVGLKAVFSIVNNLDFRLEGYGFQAGRSIMRNDQNQAVFSEPFQDRYFIGAAAFVFQSPLGPVSLNLNYYENRTDGPWSFLFNFGYTIFNRSIYQP